MIIALLLARHWWRSLWDGEESPAVEPTARSVSPFCVACGGNNPLMPNCPCRYGAVMG